MCHIRYKFGGCFQGRTNQRKDYSEGNTFIARLMYLTNIYDKCICFKLLCWQEDFKTAKPEKVPKASS